MGGGKASYTLLFPQGAGVWTSVRDQVIEGGRVVHFRSWACIWASSMPRRKDQSACPCPDTKTALSALSDLNLCCPGRGLVHGACSVCCRLPGQLTRASPLLCLHHGESSVAEVVTKNVVKPSTTLIRFEMRLPEASPACSHPSVESCHTPRPHI